MPSVDAGKLIKMIDTLAGGGRWEEKEEEGGAVDCQQKIGTPHSDAGKLYILHLYIYAIYLYIYIL